jgi:parvulin-like peptidyl-prolyl isomerase
MTRKKGRTSTRRTNRAKLTGGMLIGGVCIVALSIAARYWFSGPSASAEAPGRSLLPGVDGRAPTGGPTANRTSPRAAEAGRQTSPAPPPSDPSPGKIVATVNGQDVTRSELAQECLRHYGTDVLERLINVCLLREACSRQNISVTEADVRAEVERMATTFGLSVEHWQKMLREERGIKPKEYAELVWQFLAMRKLAGARLEVTQQELFERYEREFGEAVNARMIVCDDPRTAEAVRAAAAASPEEFGRLAREKSVDAPSASLDGLVQPIRKHTGFPEFEQVAFQMRDGEVSRVIPLAGQYVILKRESLRPAMKVAFEQVKMRLIEKIRSEKSRRVAHEVLRELQDHANVQNLLTDPVQSRRMPGVAAVVDGRKITIRELAEACIERHGETVLEGTINRRLLEQALKRQKVTITPADLDEEIARAASEYLPLKPDGSPDVQKWIAMKTEGQNISVDVYRSDEVWPSVVLKKLAGNQVRVTEDDLRKGYEANFGSQVRCLAIVLDEMRRAQRVWEMANSNRTPEYFGELAAEYSMDPSSKTLRGHVPPIQRHGGQPELEKAAFSLRPGELSSIIQVAANRYVILLCEGHTAPVDVDFAEVRDEIYADLYKKKLRIAMANYFQQLQDGATVDNYLAGTSHRPTGSRSLPTAARRSTRR